MWFAAGFTAASALCAYVLSLTVALYLGFSTAVFSVGLLLFQKRKTVIVAIVFLGAAVGTLYFWCYDQLVFSKLRSYDGTTAYISFEAADYAFETGYGYGVDGRTELDGRKVSVRLYYNGPATVAPGDVLKGSARIRYTPEGGLQNSTYHKAEGIFLLCYAENSFAVFPAQEHSAKYMGSYLRKMIANRLELLFPESTAAFARALLLGDDSGLSYAENISLQKSGIRHVIAVSGLHVSIMMSILYWITGKRKLLTLFTALPLLFLFAAVVGFTPSVVRACVMQALILLSVALEKDYDPLTALSSAVLLMLVVNPLAVTSVSLQLSVCCMIGMFTFSNPIREYLMDRKRLGRYPGKSLKGRIAYWFAGSVSISLGTMVLTLPLCACYFGMVSVIGILTNLLTLWAVSIAFCGIIAACLLSLLWIPMGGVVAYAISAPMHYVLFIAKVLAKIPFGVAYTNSVYTVVWIVASIVILTGFLLCKKKKPLMLICSIFVLYSLSLFASWLEPRMDSVRMTAVDVGQGQCIILQCGNETYMVDCGGTDPKQTATSAMNWLHAQGVFTLDGLILTHFDTDHTNAVPYLLEVMDVETVYLPDSEPEDTVRRQIIRQGYPVFWVKENAVIEFDDAKLHLFPAAIGTSQNESSMCILFRGKSCDILITGDRNLNGEHLLLEQGRIPDVDVLVAGHHGADTSTGLELLQAVKPEIAVISAGTDNINGHPHRETISRLEGIGCMIRRTDLEGTIIIRG